MNLFSKKALTNSIKGIIIVLEIPYKELERRVRMNKPYFPVLEAELSRRGIKKKEIAKTLGISDKSMSNKLTGKNELTLSEILCIQQFIPDVPMSELFSHDVTV